MNDTTQADVAERAEINEAISKMKLVIDMPETMVNDLLNLEADCDGGMNIRPLELVIEAIKNGTPLPKGHGDLIDKSAYRKEFLDSRDFEPMKILDFQPVIVKADKGE
jgi:hypothetical protein